MHVCSCWQYWCVLLRLHTLTSRVWHWLLRKTLCDCYVRPSPVCSKHNGESGRKRGVRPHDILLPCLLVIYLQWEIQGYVTEWRVHRAPLSGADSNKHTWKCHLLTNMRTETAWFQRHVTRITAIWSVALHRWCVGQSDRAKVVLACLSQKQERMSFAIWRRIVWQNCTVTSETPPVFII